MRQAEDRAARLLLSAFAIVPVVVTALFVLILWTESKLAREQFGWRFLITTEWDPVKGAFGALPFLYGTVVTSALALVIAVPLGLGAAIFLAELAPPRASAVLSYLAELLAAVPSVIYGLVALFVLVPVLREHIEPSMGAALGFLPLFRGPVLGIGYLAAGLVLAIMILPFLVAICREALLQVPVDRREAALALGATRWEAIWIVVVPSARHNIGAAVLLALSRALGETMAVTMVVGNDPRIQASLFATGHTIAAALANEFAEASLDVHLHSLVGLGMVLFLVTVVVNAAARVVTRARSEGAR